MQIISCISAIQISLQQKFFWSLPSGVLHLVRNFDRNFSGLSFDHNDNDVGVNFGVNFILTNIENMYKFV